MELPHPKHFGASLNFSIANLHVLSAYAHAAGVVIGQRCVDGKSNEITAIPQLLETITIGKAIVTIDAMGTQKAVAQAILSKNADYTLQWHKLRMFERLKTQR